MVKTTRTLSSLWRIFLLQLQDALTYRLRALVWMSVGFCSISVLLLFWKATAAANPDAFTGGQDAVASYYLLFLLIASLVVSHAEGDIAQQHIYKGELARYLLHPISYLWFTFSGEIVWRLMSAFWATVILLILFLFGVHIAITTDILLLFLGVISIVAGIVVSYIFTVILGLCAVWMTTTKGVFELYEMSQLFLGGYMIPLTRLTSPWDRIALYAPFSSFAYTPVTILLGSVSRLQALTRIGIQLAWIVLFFFLYRFVWKRAVRQFTGAGQ